MREKSIVERLSDLREACKRARENPDNPTCPGCGRRDNPEFICHTIEFGVRKVDVCAECADQHIYNLTGCRFGILQSSGVCLKHEDCNGARHPLQFQKLS